MKAPRVKLRYQNKTVPSERIHISSIDVAVDVLRGAYDLETIDLHESIYIVLLNTNNHVLGWEEVSRGTTRSASIDIKKVMQLALLTNASAIIVSHNHPSGNTNPSGSDEKLTKSLQSRLKMFDILLIDHIIITRHSYYSFACAGNL